MKVLVAPDAFTGTLSAVEAAEAIARGWSRRAPDDTLTLAPMADGGPGFVDVLHAVLGGELSVTTVAGPLGEPVPVTLLHVGETVYLESAQACGLHLVEPDRRDPERATTTGVGQALLAGLELAPRRVVVGLGGGAANDGGAGMLGALGADADRRLDGGPRELAGIGRVDLTVARARFADVDLVAASDVETALLGMFGTTRTYGQQRGLDEAGIQRVDALLDELVVACCGATPSERRVADAPGAGAAGGLGFGLGLLGAATRSGIELVAEAGSLPALARECDLIVTGEGTYDFSSRSGKVVHGVAQIAGTALRPCIVLAGAVLVGAREMRAMGVESAYAMADLVGEDAARSQPATSLATLAERIARTWSY